MVVSKNNPEMPLTLGILGGGQLAKMLALAAYRMGLNVAIIEKGENTPAGDMTQLEFTNGWNDEQDLQTFAEVSDIITLENEFIDPAILETIEKAKPVYPSSKTMKLVRDKYIQKITFHEFGVPVPEFVKIDSIDELYDIAEKFSFPFLVKTRTLGYDGYGNFTVKSKEDIKTAWDKFNTGGRRELMAEKFVNFKKELAVMVARSVNGEVKAYPCVETIQQNHICHKVIAPAEIPANLLETACDMAVKCVKSIDGVGIFGIELFLDDNNNILVNEIAPRPHNSGHYTIEGCYTSQYENCLRAILGLPLGNTDMIKNSAVMINLLGERGGVGVPHNVADLLAVPGVHLHLYNKKQSRVGRKMGHITAIGDDAAETRDRAEKAFDLLKW